MIPAAIYLAGGCGGGTNWTSYFAICHKAFRDTGTLLEQEVGIDFIVYYSSFVFLWTFILEKIVDT